MPVITPVKPRRAYMQIVDQIIGLIDAGEFADGSKLPPERELAESLNVGRSTLREALAALRVMGLIETRQGQGTFVSKSVAKESTEDDFSSYEAESPFAIMELRRSIEPAVAAAAASRHSEEDLERIVRRLHLAQHDESPEPIASDVFSRSDREFHLAIAKAAGNPLFVRVGKLIHELMSQELWLTLMRESSLATRGRWQEAIDEHWGIYDAIERGSAELAASRMKGHLIRVEQLMLEAEWEPE